MEKFNPLAVKDAWFCVAVFGKGQTSKVLQGWDNLVKTVTAGFYGDSPTPSMTATAIAFLSDVNEWVFDQHDLPFNLIIHGDNGAAVEIFRIAETANLDAEKVQ